MQRCLTAAGFSIFPPYTLIETAKLSGADLNAWLADTLASILDYEITKVDELMPWRWNRKRSDRTVSAVMPAMTLRKSSQGWYGPIADWVAKITHFSCPVRW